MKCEIAQPASGLIVVRAENGKRIPIDIRGWETTDEVADELFRIATKLRKLPQKE